MLHLLHSNRPLSATDALRSCEGNPDRRATWSRVALASNFPVKIQETTNHDYIPVPWNNATCAPCTSELDCRALDQFCNRDGCCFQGECKTDEDCFALFSNEPYYSVRSFESFGNDLNPLHPQDNPTVLKAACSINPACVAYNSYGMLKHDLQPASSWISQPPITGLAPWITYIKKTELDNKNPHIKMTRGIKTFCSRSVNAVNSHSTSKPATNGEEPFNFRDVTGICRTCLNCESDNDCPSSTICNKNSNCCVNNPCYSATPENGKWVNAHYSRDSQCVCPEDKPFCCLNDPENIHSTLCSATSCDLIDKHTACSYICEDPRKQFDAVFCKANQRCCNAAEGAPVCCSPGTDCNNPTSPGNQCEAVTVTTPSADAGAGDHTPRDSTRDGLVTCASKSKKFEDVFCFPTQLCCNNIDTHPPVCCNNPAAGCHPDTDGGNGCKYSDLDYK